MSAPNPPLVYFVLHGGVEQGPFTLEMIGSMIAAGIYFAPLQVRESLSEDYQILEISQDPPAEFPAVPKPAVRRKATQTRPALRITAGFLVGCVLIILLLVISRDPTPKVDYEAMAMASSDSRRRETPAKRGMTAEEALEKQFARHRKNQEPPRLSSSNLPSDSALFLTDGDGQIYYLSNADFARLSPISDKLDLEGEAIEMQKKQNEMTYSLLEAEVASRGKTKQAVEEYNRSVTRIYQQLDDRIRAFNRRVDDFNAELKRVGRSTPY